MLRHRRYTKLWRHRLGSLELWTTMRSLTDNVEVIRGGVILFFIPVDLLLWNADIRLGHWCRQQEKRNGQLVLDTGRLADLVLKNSSHWSNLNYSSPAFDSKFVCVCVFCCVYGHRRLLCCILAQNRTVQGLNYIRLVIHYWSSYCGFTKLSGISAAQLSGTKHQNGCNIHQHVCNWSLDWIR
jgi:hypothetical protein